MLIRDLDVPDHGFCGAWTTISPEVHRRLSEGEKILIHCRGGLGRTGLLAAKVLVERGEAATYAIRTIRRVRHGAIETAGQERYVERYASGPFIKRGSGI